MVRSGSTWPPRPRLEELAHVRRSSRDEVILDLRELGSSTEQHGAVPRRRAHAPATASFGLIAADPTSPVTRSSAISRPLRFIDASLDPLPKVRRAGRSSSLGAVFSGCGSLRRPDPRALRRPRRRLRRQRPARPDRRDRLRARQGARHARTRRQRLPRTAPASSTSVLRPARQALADRVAPRTRSTSCRPGTASASSSSAAALRAHRADRPGDPGLLDDLDPQRAGRDQLPFLRESGDVVNARTTELDGRPVPDAGVGAARAPRPVARGRARAPRRADRPRLPPGHRRPGRRLARARALPGRRPPAVTDRRFDARCTSTARAPS